MGIIDSDIKTTKTRKISLETMKALIAADLKEDLSKVTVRYNISEVGGDFMDRYLGTNQVTSIEIVITD